jgi:hypothetical protein
VTIASQPVKSSYTYIYNPDRSRGRGLLLAWRPYFSKLNKDREKERGADDGDEKEREPPKPQQ